MHGRQGQYSSAIFIQLLPYSGGFQCMRSATYIAVISMRLKRINSLEVINANQVVGIF